MKLIRPGLAEQIDLVWELYREAPAAPMDEVDSSIRAAGGDPEAIGREGKHLAEALLKVRRLTAEVETQKRVIDYARERRVEAEARAKNAEADAAQARATILEQFVEAYRREIYGVRGRADFATDEAYVAACRLLGCEP